jgi:hypothetical protein
MRGLLSRVQNHLHVKCHCLSNQLSSNVRILGESRWGPQLWTHRLFLMQLLRQMSGDLHIASYVLLVLLCSCVDGVCHGVKMALPDLKHVDCRKYFQATYFHFCLPISQFKVILGYRNLSDLATLKVDHWLILLRAMYISSVISRYQGWTELNGM